MKHITPSKFGRFFCAGSQCPAPCAAPVDMTWTRTLGNYCETGLCLACPKAAEQILLHPEQTTFRMDRDDAPAMPLVGITEEQLELMLDARRTMDLLVQNRDLPLRTDVVLALTYGAEFSPMIATGARYAYEELDWGYTEQPYRQVQAVVQVQGGWEIKRSDLCQMLAQFGRLCQSDDVLGMHLRETGRMLQRISGEEYRQLRDRFDEAMMPRRHLFENLLVYFVHRYFLANTQEQTVVPGLRLMATSYAVIRAMAARIWHETGALTDEVMVSLCWHYARAVEESPQVLEVLRNSFETEPLYSRERLQRLLWN